MSRLAKHQTGVSLISTMVGLLLGMVAIVGVMSVYKVLVFRSMDIRGGAKQEAQVQTSMMTVQMELLAAGYGVEANTHSCAGAAKPGPSASANTDLVLLNGATLPTGNSEGLGRASRITIGNSAESGNALVWHTKVGGVERCAGLMATGGGLFKLTSSTNCSDATDWDDMTWTADSLIERDTLKSNDVASITARKVADCSPYASIPATSAVEVVLSMGHSNATRATTTICLPNICQ